MAKKSIKLNYLYNVSYEILLLITPLITTPYISRVLHADGVGKVSFAESIVSYFVMFACLGTATLGQREVSYVQDDKEKRSKVFWNIFLIRTISTIVSLITFGIFMGIYKENIVMYAWLSVNILAVMFDVSWMLRGIEEFGKIVGRNFVFKILSIVFIFVFVKTENDVIIYVIGLVVLNILSNVSLWIYLPKFITGFKRYYIEIKLFIKDTFMLFIPTIAIQVYTVLDKTMIGIFTTGDVQNGYYEQSLRISKMVLTLVTSLGAVMIPRIGYYLGKKDQERVKHYMYRGYQFVWLLGIPLCFGLMCVSDNMVPWFFGPGYEEVKTLLKLSALLILAIGISNITGMQYLIPARKQKEYNISIISGAVCNVILNLILIPRFFALGATIASIVAEALIAGIQLFYVRKELSIKKIFGISWKYFLSGITMISILIVENIFLKSSIVNTGIMILSGLIIYVGMLLLLRDDFLIENINIMKNKVLHR